MWTLSRRPDNLLSLLKTVILKSFYWNLLTHWLYINVFIYGIFCNLKFSLQNERLHRRECTQLADTTKADHWNTLHCSFGVYTVLDAIHHIFSLSCLLRKGCCPTNMQPNSKYCRWFCFFTKYVRPSLTGQSLICFLSCFDTSDLLLRTRCRNIFRTYVIFVVVT